MSINSGLDFELATKEVFEVMGYTADHDLLISGTQLDILLTRRLGSITDIYVVECKDYAKKISMRIIKEFHTTLLGARKNFPNANGILVSRLPLTKEATVFAVSVGIQHSTLAELESSLIDLSQYAQNIIEAYGRNPINEHYIPLNVRPHKELRTTIKVYDQKFNSELNIEEHFPIRRSRGKIDFDSNADDFFKILPELSGHSQEVKAQLQDRSSVRTNKESAKRYFADSLGYQAHWHGQRLIHGRSLITEVEQWMVDDLCPFMIILGDYGTGKTSGVAHLENRYAQAFLKAEEASRCPVTLNLKDFPNGITLREFYDHLAAVFNCQHLNQIVIQRFAQNGRFLIFLDGFDEMGVQVDHRMRRIHFASISKLVALPNSKVIITGRPTYFPTTAEMEEILSLIENDDENYNTNFVAKQLTLAPLTPIQVTAYIDSFRSSISATGVDKIKKFIDEVYNLKDLAERPFLLDLIVQTIPDMQTESNLITPAVLYDLYTKKWIDREQSKGETRWLIKAEEKNVFMTEIAWKMLEKNTVEIHFSELSDWVQNFFGLESPEIVDYFSHDIRTCSFLARNDDGNYFFIHRSFMEYFLAKKIVEEARKGTIIDTLFTGISVSSLTSNSIAFSLDMFSDSADRLSEVADFLFSDNQLLNTIEIVNSSPAAHKKQLVSVLLAADSPVRDKLFIGDVGESIFIMDRNHEKRDRSEDVEDTLFCSFCDVSQYGTDKLITSDDALICADCVKLVSLKILNIGARTRKVEDRHCSFCAKNEIDVKYLFTDKKTENISICDECHDLCCDIIAEESTPPKLED